jgi:hypothetical protein
VPSTCQTGIRWPHQSCLLTHQSWMFSSQLYHVFSKRCGIILISPLRTASTPFCAMPAVLTNHCVDTNGSITSPPRCDLGTRCICGFTSIASPAVSMSAQIVSRAFSRLSAGAHDAHVSASPPRELVLLCRRCDETLLMSVPCLVSSPTYQDMLSLSRG